MCSWFTLAFLAAASAFTWLGVRLLGVRLGPTDWLDAVDLKMTNKNLKFVCNHDDKEVKIQPVVVVETTSVAGYTSCTLQPVRFWGS